MKNCRHLAFTFVVFAVLSLSFLSGCGKKSSNATPTVVNGPISPETPEPQGRMDVQPATEETTVPVTPPVASTCTGEDCENEEPGVLKQTQVTPITSPICKDGKGLEKSPVAGVRCPVCAQHSFEQEQAKVQKLDILFVIDTSPSLATERTAIGNGIRHFIEALPADTDVHIGVMPAHSDQDLPALESNSPQFAYKGKKSTGLAGQLVSVGSDPVLKKSDYPDWSSLSKALIKKFNNTPADSSTDGGEAGLYSLDKGISEPLLSKNRKLGLFREDAALAIIFVSDENDLCSYGTSNYPEGVVPKPNNVDVPAEPGNTLEERAHRKYCRDANDNSIVNSRSVYEKLMHAMEIKDTKATPPILISGIVYTSEATVPKKPSPNEKNPQYFVENETGYGYLDIIRDSEGSDYTPVDISLSNYDEGLQRIGERAAEKMEVKKAYHIDGENQIDPRTVCVTLDGKEIPRVSGFGEVVSGPVFTLDKGQRRIDVRGNKARNAQGGPSKVELFYCEPKDVIDFSRERFPGFDFPTNAEHYRGLNVPPACTDLIRKIQAGEYDKE